MSIRYYEYTNEIEHWKPDWGSVDSISKGIQLAVICSEDQKFLLQNGFHIEAIEKAYEHNKTGKRIKGGSAISQQTEKKCILMAKP